MFCPPLAELPPPSFDKVGWPWTEETPQMSKMMSDGSPWPCITIVTPSFNHAQFIEETIRSVLLQGYSNLEYIIIDGGSQDGSIDIIRKYEPWLKYWVSEPDKGQSNAINKGFRQANGQIYAFINSDDYYLPGAFNQVAQCFKPQIGLWVGTTLQLDFDGLLKRKRVPPSLEFMDVANWQEFWFRQPGCFFSKEAFEKVGGLSEDLNYSLDFDLWLRLLDVADAQKIDATLAVARNHPKMKTQNKGGKGFAEDRIVQIRHGAEKIAIQEMIKLYEKVELYEEKLYVFLQLKKYFRRYRRFFQRK